MSVRLPVLTRVLAAPLSVNAYVPGGVVPFELVAVPESETVCGLLDAPSVIVSVPDRVPAEVGVKVTEIVQVDPAATDVPQVFDWAKSPEVVMLVIDRADDPVLVSVMPWGGLTAPTSVTGNSMCAGLAERVHVEPGRADVELVGGGCGSASTRVRLPGTSAGPEVAPGEPGTRGRGALP